MVLSLTAVGDAAAVPSVPSLSTHPAAAAAPAAPSSGKATIIRRVRTEPIGLASASVIADRIRVRTGTRFQQRRILIERRMAGTRRWVPSDRGRTDAAGWFIAQLDPGGVGVWQFRATVLPTNTARRKRAAMLTATVFPSAAAGRVVRWSQFSAGGRHTCALDESATAYCWGDGGWGALGNGGLARVDVPLPVATAGVLRGRTLTRISAGGYHTCALDNQGAAVCWGDGSHGQLGDGGSAVRRTAVDVAMPPGVRFTALSAGRGHTCAVGDTGDAYCWGAGGDGKLGTGATTDETEPVAVPLGRRLSVVDIAAGGRHTCAVTSTGRAFCWGAGGSGQLGNGSSRDSDVPVSVDSTQSFVSIAVGSDFSCGTTAGGAVLCWGAGARGQLGDGGLADRSTPGPVAVAEPLAGVTAAGRSACARTVASSAVVCWGGNESGQAGDGTLVDLAFPRTVPLPVAATWVPDVGGTHSCTVTVDAAAYCWGRGTYGQLGDDRTVDSPTPLRVAPPVR
jgi:alpha-tubulin suppressor-like RCC1 family protein